MFVHGFGFLEARHEGGHPPARPFGTLRAQQPQLRPQIEDHRHLAPGDLSMPGDATCLFGIGDVAADVPAEPGLWQMRDDVPFAAAGMSSHGLDRFDRRSGHPERA